MDLILSFVSYNLLAMPFLLYALWQPVLSEEIQFLYSVDLGETSGVGGSVLASFAGEVCFSWAPSYACRGLRTTFKSVLSYCAGLGNRTQVLSLDRRCLYLLGEPAPLFLFNVTGCQTLGL